jgi:hypothetical protein
MHIYAQQNAFLTENNGAHDAAHLANWQILQSTPCAVLSNKFYSMCVQDQQKPTCPVQFQHTINVFQRFLLVFCARKSQKNFQLSTHCYMLCCNISQNAHLLIAQY